MNSNNQTSDMPVRTVGISLDDGTKAKLDRMAKDQERSRSQVVRRLVAQAKEENE